jgi:hypothetical protein
MISIENRNKIIEYATTGDCIEEMLREYMIEDSIEIRELLEKIDEKIRELKNDTKE